MNELKSIEIVAIEVHACPGSSIGSCLKEAMQVAVDEWRNVKLVHSDKVYQVNINDLFNTIAKQDRT